MNPKIDLGVNCKKYSKNQLPKLQKNPFWARNNIIISVFY